MRQSTSNLLMIRPAEFQYNAQTAQSNSFQKDVSNMTKREILLEAQTEFDNMVEKLRSFNIQVEVIQDTKEPIKPDAIFPNNWITMSQEGVLTIFPMKNKNRRVEKRRDIIEKIKEEYEVKRVIDLTEYEEKDRALEGTGSIVFDHIHRLAYGCLSPRTDEEILTNYCNQINYKPIVFHSYDSHGQPIYHTNVVMAIGTNYVVIGMDSIMQASEKNMLLKKFEESKLEVISLTEDQLMHSFAGNMLQVENNKGDLYLVMSKTAHESLTENQKSKLRLHVELLPVEIDLIETIGGGSARCMIAENFLKKK